MAIISHINGHHQSQRMSTAAHTFATSHSTWRNLRVANNGPCLSQTHAVSCSTLATHCLSQTHAVSCSTLATPCLPQTHTVSCSMLATHCLSQTHAVSFSTLATSQGPCLSLKNTSKWFLSATRIVHRCTRCLSTLAKSWYPCLPQGCPPLHALRLSTLAKSWYPCLPQDCPPLHVLCLTNFKVQPRGTCKHEGCHFPMQKSLKMTSRTSSTFTAPVTLPSSRMARRRACAASTLSHCLTWDRKADRWCRHWVRCVR